jgi:hypothetical protein
VKISDVNEIITIEVATTDFATVGVYKVYAKGVMTLNNGPQ